MIQEVWVYSMCVFSWINKHTIRKVCDAVNNDLRIIVSLLLHHTQHAPVSEFAKA